MKTRQEAIDMLVNRINKKADFIIMKAVNPQMLITADYTRIHARQEAEALIDLYGIEQADTMYAQFA